jgi:hypothetical protein
MAINDQTVRSRQTLVDNLLRRAFNGQSRFGDVTAMQAEIDARLTRARDVPEGHKAILAIIRSVEQDSRDYREALKAAGVRDEDIAPESRALKVLSIRERLSGKTGIFYETAAPQLRVCEDVREDLALNRVALNLRP